MIIRGERSFLEKKAGYLLAQTMNLLLEKQDTVIFAIPGGRSVTAVMHHLGAEPVDWDRIHLFMVDERLVSVDHPDSNFGMVRAALLPFMDADHLHPFHYDPAAAEQGVQGYRRELAGYGGRFDLVLLSGGEDGHVASLFPEHETIFDPGEHFIHTNCAPKPPPDRMSASRILLEQSQAALLLFLGREKLEAFSLFGDETKSVEHCPAKLIRQIATYYILAEREKI